MNTNTQRKNQSHIIRLVKFVYFGIALLVGGLIMLKSADYLVPDFSTGFLSDKEAIFPYYRFFLYAHMLAAPVALLAGLFQFSFARSAYHKYAGRLYFISIVFLAAPAGFMMSFQAIGGLWSTVNFILLSGTWVFFTLKAVISIRKDDIKKHRQHMIRSFILTNSAILIRILSLVNNHFLIVDVVTGYILISWLSWVPGLLVYELTQWLKVLTVARHSENLTLP